MNILMIILLHFICFFSVIATFLILPFVSRKNVSFGINIPEELYDNDEIKNIRKTYLRKGLFSGILIGIIVVTSDILINNQEITALIITSVVFLLIIIFAFFYLAAYKDMKKLKAESNWKLQSRQVIVIDTDYRKGKYLVSPLWFGLYFVVIIATVLFGILLYSRAPEQIPMHFDFSGNVNRYAEKSFGVLLTFPLTQFFLTIVFIFSYWMIGKSKQQIDAGNPEVSKEQSRKFRYRWSAFLVFSGLGLVVIFLFIQASIMGLFSTTISTALPMIFSALMMIGIIILIITTGQSGNRITVQTININDGTKITRDDDRFWKLGFLYYNPNDPALFVEKRFGIGWTINMGRPLALIIFIGIIVLAVGYSFLTIFLSK